MTIFFEQTNSDYSFTRENEEIAYGAYENGQFMLFFQEKIYNFLNAMQAYSFLNSQFNINKIATQKTLDLLKPVHYSSDMTPYQKNSRLKGVHPVTHYK